MNCLNCGASLNESSHCPNCGFDVVIQKKAVLLSNQYYNMGLEKAEIRDLSGAIDLLKRSLKFNKLNIAARNLLGLVYFETGEAVSALSEWVISKNIMPEGNVAAEYIDQLQSNANKLDTINQTIKKYNEALVCCRSGSSDIAMIQLKKILSQNPKLIKAYHLLALNYIEQESYEKARKILKKAAKIDKTNSTTLRFLREVDEQTGLQTSLEPRWGRNRERVKASREREYEYSSENDSVIVPPTFRESSTFATLLNLGFGLVVGAFVVWFLAVPATTQRINREANSKITEYSNAMAAQAAELDKKDEQIQASEETVNSAQEQIDEAGVRVTSYENLIKALGAYQEGAYTNAANALMNVDPDLLSVDAKEIYDNIYTNVRTTMFNRLSERGEELFDNADYEGSIEPLTQAMEIDATDYKVLNYLAHAYRMTGDNENAVKIFEAIVKEFEGSKKATDAQAYIDSLGAETDGGTGGETEDDQGDTGNDDPVQGEPVTEEDGEPLTEQDPGYGQ